MAVLVRVADAHHAAVVERYAARALDLQEEGVDRIVDVHERLARERAPCRASMSARGQYGTTRLPSRRPRSRLSLSSG